MRCPISYYGGKQNMVSVILPMFPKHTCYIEPFFGGGSLFWAKQPCGNEVVNDLNSEVVNFMQVLQNQFKPLQKMLAYTVGAEVEHRKAKLIYKNPECFTEVERAWAFFIQTNLSSQNRILGGYAFAKSTESQRGVVLFNNKKVLRSAYMERMKGVAIMNRDAVAVLKQFDSEVAFAYCDPPYFNSDCGHYKGYTESDYLRLLDVLTTFKGKWLLSSYPNPLAEDWANQFGFTVLKKEMLLRAGSSKDNKQKTKTEMLILNYKPVQTNSLF